MDRMVELLINRALLLGEADVHLQVAAGELIRASGNDLDLLRRAHTEATARFPEFGEGIWAGELFTPLFAAIVSLEEEEAASHASPTCRPRTTWPQGQAPLT